MKNKWKKFWIACGAIAGLGVLLLVIAMIQGVTWGDYRAQFPDGISIGSGRVGINIGSLGRGSREHRSESFSNIENLDIQIGLARLEMITHDEDTIRVEVEDSGNNRIEYYERNGTLYIETRNRGGVNFSFGRGGTDTPAIYVYLPQDIEFEEVDISVGAGELIAEGGLLARELNVEVGAGRVVIEKADFIEEASIRCGAGEVILTLIGAKEDYDFRLTYGIGRIVVGDSSHAGLGGNIILDHGQDRPLTIDYGVGSVEVHFER